MIIDAHKRSVADHSVKFCSCALEIEITTNWVIKMFFQQYLLKAFSNFTPKVRGGEGIDEFI